MTVRVERQFALAAEPEEVWAFISDPEKRAGAISVVDEFELRSEDGREATWHVSLPIPMVRRTVRVDTRDVTREPPTYVEFTGTSKVMNVVGKHRIEERDEGCVLINEFVVDGKLPGVERFFKRNLDGELENLERALRDDLHADG
ncbi:SRPBCC family protein [Natronorarus salvus]|uniref:SRPBCC family protein n=1 Tax=Natronorarus salvus TaxID=3117733 RepID=UPI002F264E71